ncbi:hypothetical protein L1987_78417 [Smallanthus sonchifolius]|uniref:Uncharacterized protein n=1 Tax=Smallanthus sonchifolius TaxID=185202 RepID=A0ACB8ZCM0_9ASTR|nr:hypothetical protein L1987_78417 [Smallanthus sonchifolius]
MEGYRDARMDSIGVEKPPDEGGATPLRGISLKVTNIDGNPLLPRRGLYSTSKGSILDGLRDISKPVGEPTVNPANNQSNKLGPIYSDGMHNASYQAESSTNVVREPLSFAKVVQINKEAVKVNFRTMESSEVIDGADVVIPLSSVKQNVTVGIPALDGNGYSKAEIKIEYDWEPLRCSSCCVFGHNDSACPRKPKPGVNAESVRNPDDFEEVVAKNKKGNNQGLLMKNQKPKFVYRPVDDGGNQDEAKGGRVEQMATLKSKVNREKLDEVITDDVEMDDLLADIPKFLANSTDNNGSEGASTPGQNGIHG